MADTPGLATNTITALVTQEGDNEISRTDNRLEVLLKSLLKKEVTEKL